jgi:[histone H3]-lysine79 N-trimethyltransferase
MLVKLKKKTQKILETGRQIEAGKLMSNTHYKQQQQQHHNKDSLTYGNDYKKNSAHSSGVGSGDAMLMPAPQLATAPATAMINKPLQQQIVNNRNMLPMVSTSASVLPKSYVQISTTNTSNPVGSVNKLQESHKVVNFEDRLKSIITSVLQGQDQPKPQMQQLTMTPVIEAQQKKNSNQQMVSSSHSYATKSHYNPNNYPSAAVGSSNNIVVTTTASTHHQLNSTTTITAAAPSPISPYKQQKHGSSSKISPSSSSSKYGVSSSVGHGTVSQPHHSAQKISPSSLIYQHLQDQNHHHHQQTHSLQHSQYQDHHSAQRKGEFKAPSASSTSATDLYNDRRSSYERQLQIEQQQQLPCARSSSAESLDREYYSRGSGEYITVTNQTSHSRPGSSSSQPDYTQVSPAKMALRRHLSQEKLAHQQIPPGSNYTSSSKTIGDLVNGEIERTLEISNQSIINAAINISAAAIINTNVQRPERCSVRILDEPGYQQPTGNLVPIHSPVSRPNSRDSIGNRSRSPSVSSTPSSSVHHLHGQSNLATLAHVASYNHGKALNQSTVASTGHKSAQNSIKTQHYSSTSSAQVVYQQPSTGSSNSTGRSTSNVSAAQSYNPSKVGRNIEQVPSSYMALPRAEMKPYFESYFTEDHKPPAQLKHLASSSTNSSTNETVVQYNRLRQQQHDGHSQPPLEGLAASLQARVIASLRIKEEAEEKARRNAEYVNSCVHSSNSVIQSGLIKTEESVGMIGGESDLKKNEFFQNLNKPKPIIARFFLDASYVRSNSRFFNFCNSF